MARHSQCGEDKAGGTEEELLTVGQCNVLFKGGVREAGGTIPFGPVPYGVMNTVAFGSSAAAVLGSPAPCPAGAAKRRGPGPHLPVCPKRQ